MTSAASEPAFDPQYFHIELAITLKRANDATSTAFTQGLLGIGALHESLSGRLSQEILPLTEASVFNDLDVASWQTLDIGSVWTFDRRMEGRVDSLPSKSPFHWVE